METYSLTTNTLNPETQSLNLALRSHLQVRQKSLEVSARWAECYDTEQVLMQAREGAAEAVDGQVAALKRATARDESLHVELTQVRKP